MNMMVGRKKQLKSGTVNCPAALTTTAPSNKSRKVCNKSQPDFDNAMTTNIQATIVCNDASFRLFGHGDTSEG